MFIVLENNQISLYEKNLKIPKLPFDKTLHYKNVSCKMAYRDARTKPKPRTLIKDFEKWTDKMREDSDHLIFTVEFENDYFS